MGKPDRDMRNPLPDSTLLNLLQRCQEDNRAIIKCVTGLLSSQKTEDNVQGVIPQPQRIEAIGKQPEVQIVSNLLVSDNEADKPHPKASMGRGMGDGTIEYPHFSENGRETDIKDFILYPTDSLQLKSSQNEEAASSDSDNLDLDDRTCLMIDGRSDIDEDQSSISMVGNCSTDGESVFTDVSEDIILTERLDISDTSMSYNSETFLKASQRDMDGAAYREIDDMENTNSSFENRDDDHIRGDVGRSRPEGQHFPTADTMPVSDNESECDAVCPDSYPNGIEHQSFDSQEAVSSPLCELHSARISQTPIPGSLNVSTMGYSRPDIRSPPDYEMENTYMSSSTTSQRSLDNNRTTGLDRTNGSSEERGISDRGDVGMLDQHDTDETASDWSGPVALSA